MDIKILIAAHKKYEMPNDPVYLPIHVGKKDKVDFGYIGDNTGENISQMNPRFCELTAIYWAWKNLKADYIGLVHYRRHFTAYNVLKRGLGNKFKYVMSKEQLENELKKYDLILPKKRKYYIESMRSHFVHLPYTYEKDLDILREVLKKFQPEYLSAFEKVMNRSWAHMFNMFVMRKEIFDSYCEWLFPILFEVDRRIDVSKYTRMEARAVAYFGEFMIDVWNEKNNISYKELKIVFMEKQNWIIKGGKFLLRNFKHK